MLTLTFLGVGSAFAKRNYQSNALIEAWSDGVNGAAGPEDSLWIDFGGTATRAIDGLRQQSEFSYLNNNGLIDYARVRRVFITHLHNDHIGGLEELAIMTRYAARRGSRAPVEKPELISGAEVLTNLWEHSLSGGLTAQAGRPAKIVDYFRTLPLAAENGRFLQSIPIGERYEAMPFLTNHVQIERAFDWPSFGLLLRDRVAGLTAVFSGDTRFDPFIVELMSAALVNFHEVQLASEAEPVHTLWSQLTEIPQSVRGKTHLYHYEDSWDQFGAMMSRVGFAGWACPGRRYEVFVGG